MYHLYVHHWIWIHSQMSEVIWHLCFKHNVGVITRVSALTSETVPKSQSDAGCLFQGSSNEATRRIIRTQLRGDA